MRGRKIMGSPQPDGRGIQFLYRSDGRMISSARITGNIEDENILQLLDAPAGNAADAYCSMIHYPTIASMNLLKMHLYAGKNSLCTAGQGHCRKGS